MGATSVIILIISAVLFSAGGILVGKLLVKSKPSKVKGEAYECGVPTQGQSWVQFSVGYYLFALVFLVFDVELVFLYPWAVVAKNMGWIALVEVTVFLTILFLGFLYAHKKGALRWM
ncbi:MAG: NADH-quinone oxidoreductase subunit A [Bacteroidia bacterium]|nr:NADH-quinone oxidoreductase subunit A [Bacteroidia bacterium]MCZ2276483.1 NADH-quinone oxidoreductase subunit A [Bacteroidia bacterium]